MSLIYDNIMSGEIKTSVRLGVLTEADGVVTAVSVDTAPFDSDFNATVARTLNKADEAEQEEFTKELIGGTRALAFKASKIKLKPSTGETLTSGDDSDSVEFEIANSSTVLKSLWGLKTAQTPVVIAGLMTPEAGTGKPDHAWSGLGMIKTATPNPDNGFETIQITIEMANSYSTAIALQAFNDGMGFAGATPTATRKFYSYGEDDTGSDGITVTGFETADLASLFAGQIVLLDQSYA